LPASFASAQKTTIRPSVSSFGLRTVPVSLFGRFGLQTIGSSRGQKRIPSEVEVIMRTPATIARHPLHPMLIVFPIALWIFSLICDFVTLAPGGAEAEALWSTLALYTMIGGVVGALAAAIPGLIDLLSLSKPEIKRIAVTHMTINLAVVVLYVVNIWLRVGGMESRLPVGLSILTVLMLAVSGWLGAEMVHVHHVGVEPAMGDRRHAEEQGSATSWMQEERRMEKHIG
jgi:uncharacterized membrane protein